MNTCHPYVHVRTGKKPEVRPDFVLRIASPEALRLQVLREFREARYRARTG